MARATNPRVRHQGRVTVRAPERMPTASKLDPLSRLRWGKRVAAVGVVVGAIGNGLMVTEGPDGPEPSGPWASLFVAVTIASLVAWVVLRRRLRRTEAAAHPDHGDGAAATEGLGARLLRRIPTVGPWLLAAHHASRATDRARNRRSVYVTAPLTALATMFVVYQTNFGFGVALGGVPPQQGSRFDAVMAVTALVGVTAAIAARAAAPRLPDTVTDHRLWRVVTRWQVGLWLVAATVAFHLGGVTGTSVAQPESSARSWLAPMLAFDLSTASDAAGRDLLIVATAPTDGRVVVLDRSSTELLEMPDIDLIP